MINTAVIVVKCFGTSSEKLLKFYLKLGDIIHCNLNDFISFNLVFFLSIKITLKMDFGK